MEQNVTLKTKEYRIPPTVHMVQDDTGRTLVCTVEDWTIPESATATLWCVRPSGSVYSYTGTIDTEHGKVSFDLDDAEGALTQEGCVAAQVKIEDDGEVISTFQLNIIVHRSLEDVVTPEQRPTWEELEEKKLDKPEESGTSGQVLALDENGNTVWITVQGGGGGGNFSVAGDPYTSTHTGAEIDEAIEKVNDFDFDGTATKEELEAVEDEIPDVSGLQSQEITDAGGYFTTDTVEGALQEIGASLGSKQAKGVVKTASYGTVTLEANNTIVIPEDTASVAVTLPTPVSGEDYLCSLIFKATASFAFSDTAPTGYALHWTDNPTWTEGKVYEIIYRCLWITDSNDAVIISAKWGEV